MTTFSYEIGYLRAGLVSLEDYLLADALYWPIGVTPAGPQPPYPRLTLEGVLMARMRLNALRLTLAQQAELGKLLPELDLVRSRWRVAWEKKASLALGSRLNMWRNFLDEYRHDPEAHHDRYAYEVRLRVMLHLLQPEAAVLPPAQMEMLDGLDLLLKELLEPDGFIWDPNLQAGFPEATYWYLYGDLPGERADATGSV